MALRNAFENVATEESLQQVAEATEAIMYLAQVLASLLGPVGNTTNGLRVDVQNSVASNVGSYLSYYGAASGTRTDLQQLYLSGTFDISGAEWSALRSQISFT